MKVFSKLCYNGPWGKGMRSVGADCRAGAAALPFWKEPAREDDMRASMFRCEGPTVVRTLRTRSWIKGERIDG